VRTEEHIRQEIFEKVRELHDLRRRDGEFRPGASKISYAGRVFDEKEMVALVDSSLDFWLTSGRYADAFEQELAAFLGAKYCLLTNSGSSANLLAISALTSPKLGDRRLCPGDEVITTACGFPTTLNPILQNRLKPAFVDVEEGTYNALPDQVQEAISPRTKAIFVPHTLGNPADLGVLTDLARDHGLWLVEDNCDALGSRYRGRHTGTFGDLSTCSFYPAHHITMGEGGAVVADDPLLRKIVASFRDWGRDCWCGPGCDNSCGRRFSWQMGQLPHGYDHKYIYSHIGYNLKVTDMQAAVGVEQLKKLPGFVAARRANFDRLYDAVRPYHDYFVLPRSLPDAEPSWFGFPLMVREEAPFGRAEIVQHLEDRLIATRMLFGGNLLRQPAYEGIEHRLAGPLAVTDRVMGDLFWIGVYPGLTADMLGYMADAIRQFVEARARR
jgi:CDP-6-deoxy-D-xylo-4-hexulose-3-dehydrase